MSKKVSLATTDCYDPKNNKWYVEACEVTEEGKVIAKIDPDNLTVTYTDDDASQDSEVQTAIKQLVFHLCLKAFNQDLKDRSYEKLNEYFCEDDIWFWRSYFRYRAIRFGNELTHQDALRISDIALECYLKAESNESFEYYADSILHMVLEEGVEISQIEEMDIHDLLQKIWYNQTN